MANLCIGLMSGTSLDGVDAVVIDTTAIQLLAQTYLPYPKKLKQQLQVLTQSGKIYLEDLADIDIQVLIFLPMRSMFYSKATTS